MKKIIISTLLLTITLVEIEQGLRCYDIYPAEGTNTFTEYDDDGQKALYPTFVNRGNNTLLEEGNPTLFVIKFKAKRAGKWTLKAQDGLLVDRNLSTVKF